MLKKILSTILIVSLWCLAGCTSVSDERVEELIEKDPSFKQILDEKKCIEKEALSLRKEIGDKRRRVNSKIDILRKEFKKEKKKIDYEIKRLKHRFDSERNLIKKDLNLLNRDIKVKEGALKNIERTIKDLQNLISKEGTLDISKEEIARWRNRIESLEDERRDIGKELKKLKKESGILETKLKLLK